MTCHARPCPPFLDSMWIGESPSELRMVESIRYVYSWQMVQIPKDSATSEHAALNQQCDKQEIEL